MKEAFTKIEVKENLEERKSTPKNIPKTSISFDNPYPFPYFDFQEQKKNENPIKKEQISMGYFEIPIGSAKSVEYREKTQSFKIQLEFFFTQNLNQYDEIESEIINKLKISTSENEILKFENQEKNTNLETLGVGGFGTVYVSYNPNKKSLHAVKVMKIWCKEHGFNNMNSYILELKRMVEINSWNSNYFIRMHDYFIDWNEENSEDSSIIIEMELCESSLSEYLNFMRKKLKTINDEAKTIFFINIFLIIKQIMEGLKELQDHLFLHSDIKPPNILLIKENTEFRIKFSDFGTMVSYQKYHTGKEDLRGFTKKYIPDEIIEGISKGEKLKNEKEFFKIDVYAVGMTILDLFSRDSKKIFRFTIEQKTIFKRFKEKLIDGMVSKFPNIKSLEECFIIFTSFLEEEKIELNNKSMMIDSEFIGEMLFKKMNKKNKIISFFDLYGKVGLYNRLNEYMDYFGKYSHILEIFNEDDDNGNERDK